MRGGRESARRYSARQAERPLRKRWRRTLKLASIGLGLSRAYTRNGNPREHILATETLASTCSQRKPPRARARNGNPREHVLATETFVRRAPQTRLEAFAAKPRPSHTTPPSRTRNTAARFHYCPFLGARSLGPVPWGPLRALVPRNPYASLFTTARSLKRGAKPAFLSNLPRIS